MDSPDVDSRTPPVMSPSVLPHPEVPEISMVEEEEATGVSFSPELWMQRRRWALDVLRKEDIRSVLDIGCGAGSLLETLVIPPNTVREPPIRASPPQGGQLPSPADSDEEDFGLGQELFIERLAALDSNPAVIPSAISVLSPPSSSSSFPPPQPRWEPLSIELWLGGIEKYNARLEGYEAICCLEVIEHLDPNVLSRFGVVTMGTYRPKVLLVTTPNFDFNAKFPRTEHEPKKGFMDPTGRTERVFRHSDHKLEMTSGEFREWALAAAADWGYEVELAGVGISSKPSYYPSDDPFLPDQPIYASQTAVFRLASQPTRSPRSVRSVQLPFMPGSKESAHPHRLAGKFVHPVSAPGNGNKQSPVDVRASVRRSFQSWDIGEVSLDELWGVKDVCGACAGSKRYLVGSLGGWGDVQGIPGSGDEFEVKKEKGRGLSVVWRDWVKKDKREKSESRGPAAAMDVDQPSEGAGNW